MLGKINSIIRIRINSDGEGVRDVVFLQDCPLSCEWCCNPETRFGEKYKHITTKQLYEILNRDKIYFDATGGGITFSGGEPLLQYNFIEEFLNDYGRNFKVNIETSLYAKSDVINRLIPYIDEWYVDFKIFDSEKHLKYTGVTNELILSNLQLLANKIKPEKIIITYPLITGINDTDENVNCVINFMKEIGLYRIELHPYRKNRENKYKTLNLEYIAIEPLPVVTQTRIKKQFKDNGIEVIERDVHIERRKCETLKAIRKNFCEEHDIPLSIEECKYQGRCRGTCPKCERELDFINDWRLMND